MGFNETTVNDIILSLGKQPGKIFESAGFSLTLDRNGIDPYVKKRLNTAAGKYPCWYT